MDDIRDAVLLKFDSVSDKDFDIMSFTFLDSVKLRNLPTVIDYTMKTIRNQQIGTMNQLQSLRCLQTTSTLGVGKKRSGLRAMEDSC